MSGPAGLKDFPDFLRRKCAIKYFHLVNQTIEFWRALIVSPSANIEW